METCVCVGIRTEPYCGAGGSAYPNVVGECTCSREPAHVNMRGREKTLSIVTTAL